MKKIFFTILLAAVAFAAQAQNRAGISPTRSFQMDWESVRGDGDTLTLQNLLPNYIPDSLTTYVWNAPDWGYTSGHNSYADYAWAERYDINGADSTIEVLGLVYAMGGAQGASSTAVTHFKLYSESAPSPLPAPRKLIFSGFPETELANADVNNVDLTPNNFAAAPFASPVAISSNFFAAIVFDKYQPNNLNGDSLFVFIGRQGARSMQDATPSVVSGDTFVTVRNAVRWSDDKWYDELVQNSGLRTHYAIFPVAVIKYVSSIESSISKNGLSFMGNYPNPASNMTNVVINLDKATEVKIKVMDLNGRELFEQDFGKLADGKHELQLDVTKLATGTYIYAIETPNAMLGSQLQVVK